MQIERIDHLVLTVADVEQTIAFYAEVLGMKAVSFGAGRRALGFGDQKINLHQVGREIDPKAAHPTPGSADLCLITRRLRATSAIGFAPAVSRSRRGRLPALERKGRSRRSTSATPTAT